MNAVDEQEPVHNGEARYRELVDLSPDAILVHSEGRIRFANAAAVTLLGASTVDQVLGRGITEFLASPYLRGVQEQILQAARPAGPPPLSEEPLIRLDGTTRYVEVAARAWLHEGLPSVQVFLRDVTDRHAAQEALRARETQLRLLMGSIPVVCWTTDRALCVTFVQIGGHTPGVDATRLLGRPIDRLFDDANGEDPARAHRIALGGVGTSVLVQRRGRDLHVNVEPLRDERGEIAGTVGVALDVTERREIEARAQEQRKIEALGRVAGGVAHGINNALATILGLATVHEGEADMPADLREDLRVIAAAARQGRDLAANLLGFAGQGRYQMMRLDLNEISEQIVAWMRSLRGDLRVDLVPAPDLPAVEGDPAQVRQAVVNVCQNAIDATASGGCVILSTRTRWVSTGEGRMRGIASGRYASLVVEDTGVGMTEEVRMHAIEPFFTTKDIGSGVGMGLSMAFGVLHRHGGDLRIESAPGRGTTVSLLLPSAAAAVTHPAGPVAGAPPAEVVAPTKGTVLVVDDDEWVRFSSRRILTRLGYGVAEAPDGRTALQHFEEHGRSLAFVLLDLRMPGMDGEAVLRRLVAKDPEIRVILCTGYEREQVSQRLFGVGHVGFLSKPFGPSELLEQIEKLGMRRTVAR
jgi:PAS domain S-box-containing protein